MKFKLIVVMVQDAHTNEITKAARAHGATGCTIITNARGEGLKVPSTFLGLSLEGKCDIVLLLVEQHLSRTILEAVASAGKFDDEAGTGMAIQIDIEDAIGMYSQIEKISEEIKDEL